MERRTLIRLLVGLAIGIPVLVELLTFLGLIESRLFDDDDDDGTPTDGPRRIGVGDELLPETIQTETVTDSAIRGAGSPWVFVLSVSVENAGTDPYELRLQTLTLGDGSTVAGGATSGRVAPGESGEVTGAWEIPEGSSPEELEVAAIEYVDEEPDETTTRVSLAAPPVRGS